MLLENGLTSTILIFLSYCADVSTDLRRLEDRLLIDDDATPCLEEQASKRVLNSQQPRVRPCAVIDYIEPVLVPEDGGFRPLVLLQLHVAHCPASFDLDAALLSVSSTGEQVEARPLV